MSHNQPFYLKGLRCYHVNTEILRSYYDNRNLVVLLSIASDIHKPVYYIRYQDYISSIAVKNAGYVETEEPLNLTMFPSAQKYYAERDYEKRLTEIDTEESDNGLAIFMDSTNGSYLILDDLGNDERD